MSCWPCNCSSRFKAKYILDGWRLLRPVIAPPFLWHLSLPNAAMRRLSRVHIYPSIPSSHTPPLSRPLCFSLLIIWVMDRVERAVQVQSPQVNPADTSSSLTVSPLSSHLCWDWRSGCRPRPNSLPLSSLLSSFTFPSSPLSTHRPAMWWMKGDVV